MKAVGYIKTSVAGLLTGTSIANTTYPDTALERTIREVQTKAQIPESIQPFPITLFDGVTSYLAPSTIFSDSIVDLRRQGLPSSYPQNFRETLKVRIKDFVAGEWINLPGGSRVTFENNKGVAIMRVATAGNFPRITLDTMNDATQWNASSGSVTDIENDETFYYQYPSSVRFNITGAGTNGIYRDDLSNLDMSSYEGVGTLFVAFEVGTFANISSLRVTIGSNVSNTDTFAATESFLGEFEGGVFQIVAFDLSDTPVATAGTPDYSDIAYYAVLCVTTGSVTNVRVGSIFASLPSPYELLYTTSAIFKDPVAGTLSNEISDDSDIVIYNDAAILLVEYEFALGLLLQNGGSTDAGLAQTYDIKLNKKDEGLYALYRAANPTQSLSTSGSYYDPNYM